MSAKGKKPVVPRLRFPEFLDEAAWSERKLGEIGNFVGGGTPSTSNPEYWDGNIQWYTPKEIKNRMLKPSMRTISKDGLKNSSAKLLPKGTILITTRATIGDVAVSNKECATNQGFQSLVVNETEVNLFWYYWILLHKNELIKRSSGSTFKEIRKTKIEVIPTFSPNKKEQQKIAACLTALDDLISAATGRLDALKRHKQGLMQQLFPAEGETVPRLRFAEFRGAGEWEEKRLEQVAIFLKGKGIAKSDVVPNGSVPCIRYGELYTDYQESITKVKSFVNLDLGNLVLSRINDVIIPASGETEEDIATASCVLQNDIALGGDINIIRSRIDGVFFSYYLNSAKREDIARLAQGISVVHLYPSQLKKLIISIPEKKEQQKIAACLTALDDLIAAQTQKIAKLKTHKRGLMQQLFPAVDEAHR